MQTAYSLAQSIQLVLNLIIHLFCTDCHLPTPPPVCLWHRLCAISRLVFFFSTFLHTSSRSVIHPVNKLNCKTASWGSPIMTFQIDSNGEKVLLCNTFKNVYTYFLSLNIYFIHKICMQINSTIKYVYKYICTHI